MTSFQLHFNFSNCTPIGSTRYITINGIILIFTNFTTIHIIIYNILTFGYIISATINIAATDDVLSNALSMFFCIFLTLLTLLMLHV